MAKYAIKAQVREEVGKKVQTLRDKGVIPVVLYGSDSENQNLKLNRNEFLKVYGQTGSSKIIDLQIGTDQVVPSLVHDMQYDVLTGEVIHVDFYRIKEGQIITTEVKLEFMGEAPAVKELGGILVKNHDEIEIECLPKDLELIDTIKVDLTNLKNFNDAIHVRDLQVPSQIKITVEPDDVIIFVSEPKEEVVQEIKPAAEVAVVGKEAKEGESGEAGAEGTAKPAEEKGATKGK